MLINNARTLSPDATARIVGVSPTGPAPSTRLQGSPPPALDAESTPDTRTQTWASRGLFAGTFLGAWLALDRLATSPPTAISACTALLGAAGVVVAGEYLATRRSLTEIARRIGISRRPRRRGLVAAAAVGGAVVATYLAGAAVLAVDLEVRADWPTVLAGALLFHGLAEELVWRGYAFGYLRDRHPFWRAIAWSMPLIALTHVSIIAGNGLVIGALAVLTAAVTCLPLAHLWERSGRSVWAPAILHGLIGTWQLFERTYGVEFQLLVLAASIVMPFAAFLFRDRSFEPPDLREPITNPRKDQYPWTQPSGSASRSSPPASGRACS